MLREQPDVSWRGATATTDHAQPVLIQESRQSLGQGLGTQRIDGSLWGQLRQARVGHGPDPAAGVAGKVPQVLAHLGGSRGAVQADHINAQRLKRGARSPDLGAEQHGAGGLDGDVDEDWQVHPEFFPGTFRRYHSGLGLEEILAGLNLHGVDSAHDHRLHLALVGIADTGEGDVPQARQLRAWPR